MMRRNRLQRYCNLEIPQLRKLGEYVPCIEYTDGSTAGYTFIDNKANILAVAHIDTVQQGKNFKVIGTKTVMSPRLDDRLGVYTICDLLPELGVKVDVLLCENEEQGKSTAQYFETNKVYMWIVEFDRSGDDVVFYQFDDKTLKNALKEFGFKTGYGSYSDIGELDKLGCKAFNVGVGYYNYHARDAYVNVDEYETNITRFLAFYDTYRATWFEHTYDPNDRYYTGRYYYGEDDWYQGVYGGYTYSYNRNGSKKRHQSLWEYDTIRVYCPNCGTVRTEMADVNLIDSLKMCSDCVIDKYEEEKYKLLAPPKGAEEEAEESQDYETPPQ